MFRKYLSVWTGVLVLAGLVALPGQAHAQRGRGFARPGMVPQFNRFAVDPRLRAGAFGIDPRFVDPRVRARALEIDRLLLERRLRAIDPALDRRRTIPRFGSNFDRRFVDPVIRERELLLERRFMTPFLFGF